MKIPPARAEGFALSPDPRIRAVVIYGPDQGYVRELGERLVRSVASDPNDPFRVAEIAPADAAREPGRVVDEMCALSLMGGRRAVRIRDAGDQVAQALRAVLEGPDTDSMLVIEAGDLSPGTLRRVAEEASAAAAIACYMPDPDGMAAIARQALQAEGYKLGDGVDALIGERLAGDRQLARREIEKLALYVGNTGRVTVDDVLATIGDSAEQGLDDAALAAVDGDAETVDRVLAKQRDEGTAEIAILRTAQRHLARIQLLAAQVEAGDSVDAAIGRLRPPVFFKLKPRLQQALRRWSSDRAGEALARLIEAEAMTKRTHWPSWPIVHRTLLQIARMPRR